MEGVLDFYKPTTILCCKIMHGGQNCTISPNRSGEKAGYKNSFLLGFSGGESLVCNFYPFINEKKDAIWISPTVFALKNTHNKVL